MTLEEQLDIIQAAIDGKDIECYNSISNSWQTKKLNLFPYFDFINYKDRIKPEPKKEIKLHQYLLKDIPYNVYVSSPRFYSNIDECIEDLREIKHIKVINKLPYTEITVTED